MSIIKDVVSKLKVAKLSNTNYKISRISSDNSEKIFKWYVEDIIGFTNLPVSMNREVIIVAISTMVSHAITARLVPMIEYTNDLYITYEMFNDVFDFHIGNMNQTVIDGLIIG